MPTSFTNVIIFATVFTVGLNILCFVHRCIEKKGKISNTQIEEVGSAPPLIVQLIDNMEKLKPTKFTSHKLKAATLNFTHKLGSGGFGEVYKGTLPNGDSVAVKVLKGSSDEQIEAQFIAEVRTIGRTHHVNLVRLIGFCFENTLRALVFEYLVRGSLDGFLFGNRGKLGLDKLSKIAIGRAKGIAYLHEDCQDRIIDYNIKPGNILLDQKFKTSPQQLQILVWQSSAIERRNLKVSLPENHEWFPKWVWNKLERGEMEDILKSCEIEEEDRKF
ncbi:hypothetical protein AMTR_s00019p00229940 [Amborella trichopoda]|uniref:Protein kinase domain-containing protein n=1 Tax=Amborella trichopoda TaxID=13333 RepID=W1PI84_AMBTC|nr:hypothetical protein AMTR_s00019p00229940 [Amborella trichopoda]